MTDEAGSDPRAPQTLRSYHSRGTRGGCCVAASSARSHDIHHERRLATASTRGACATSRTTQHPATARNEACAGVGAQERAPLHPRLPVPPRTTRHLLRCGYYHRCSRRCLRRRCSGARRPDVRRGRPPLPTSLPLPPGGGGVRRGRSPRTRKPMGTNVATPITGHARGQPPRLRRPTAASGPRDQALPPRTPPQHHQSSTS